MLVVSDYLLVHGAFGGGWVWDDVARWLKMAGHHVRVVDQLPSAGSDPGSLGDLNADINHVRQMLDATDKPVVLVGHSYGGMVLTELADHPNVPHSVYVTALWPQQGQSVLNLYGDVLPPNIIRRDDGALELTDDFTRAWQGMCPDVDHARAQEILSRSVLQSAASLASPSAAPERTHPTTYVIATGETDASVAAQQVWATNARLRGSGASRAHGATLAARRVG